MTAPPPGMLTVRSTLLALFLVTLPGCEPAAPEDLPGGGGCQVVGEQVDLPPELYGSSGILFSRRHPGVVWSHNDSGGEPILWGVNRRGEIVAEVHLDGVPNRDWEDLAWGPCADGGECIYVGEIGDNAEQNPTIALHRFPEPDLDAASAEVETFTLRYPDHPRDAEALFVTADARGWIISKGRSGPVALFRTPPLELPGDTLTLEWVHDLTERTPERDHRITGAGLSPSGDMLAVRSYLHLQFYRLSPRGLHPLLPGPGVHLLELREPQGEAVDLDDEGRVVLTSERLLREFPAPMTFLECRLADSR